MCEWYTVCMQGGETTGFQQRLAMVGWHMINQGNYSQLECGMCFHQFQGENFKNFYNL